MAAPEVTRMPSAWRAILALTFLLFPVAARADAILLGQWNKTANHAWYSTETGVLVGFGYDPQIHGPYRLDLCLGCLIVPPSTIAGGATYTFDQSTPDFAEWWIV